MAVSFPTKLGITSIASDVPMKKHFTEKDIKIQDVWPVWDQEWYKHNRLAPQKKCWTCLQSVWGLFFLTFVLISFIFAKYRANINIIPHLHILIYLWFNHVIVEQGH